MGTDVVALLNRSELVVSHTTLYRLMDKHRLGPDLAEADYSAASPMFLLTARPLRTAPSSVAG